ncbi:MAG: hypothetical protein HYW78_01825 [Parcubacteria group bacterium]|nr:hypothetical protein [Parcubacteria group bacterium]
MSDKNPKLQIPNYKQYRNSNDQNPKRNALPVLNLEFWSFEFVWNLVLVICDL